MGNCYERNERNLGMMKSFIQPFGGHVFSAHASQCTGLESWGESGAKDRYSPFLDLVCI